MDSKTFDVVISGMSGIFPECDNVEELEQKLMNKEDMITTDDRKWPPDIFEVPAPTGKLKRNITLDHNFFKISNHLMKDIDPKTTQNLKNAFEAICDAGVNPFDLNGSNTAVIMASCIDELEFMCMFSICRRDQSLLGQNNAMHSNRISFFLNLKGPSYAIDASWNGGLQGLQLAYDLIHSGHCEAALVGACNILFGPEISYNFQAMGRLNNDGKTKCFSANADGYTRSEACSIFFLQRAEDAKRSYGSILGIRINDYGARNCLFSDFSPEHYKELLKEAYQSAKIDPSEVSYIEAEGSASKKMDAMELNCIAEVLCANRKTPLPVGSVKSNVGHTEAASSLVSITKALIALKTGIIPPNLHYSSPNPEVPALLSGQLKVITEPTLLNGNIVGVSSVGLAGCYGHIIIKGNPKKKRYLKSQNLPWLFLVPGRTEEYLKNVIEKVKAMPFDEEFIRLSHQVFKKPIKGYSIKGYALLNAQRQTNQPEQDQYEIKHDDGNKREIWFIFSGMGSQWAGMGAELMRLPTFAKAINLCHNVLLPKGIDLLNIINSNDPQIYDPILHSFIGISSIQIGLVDVLKELGIEPDGIVGHSVGELGCAYADGCFTAEQTILAAYARGKASTDATLIKGMMAAVGMGYNEIKGQLPPSIDVACHNSSRSCTLSGPTTDMEEYIAGIKDKGIFAKLVNVSDIAYHSRYITPAGPFLLQYLKEVIPEAKRRTKRWISSSVPESSWDSDLAKYNSAEYHTNNQLSPVLFEEATAHIPERAIVIEIAPHGLLQSIVKQSLNSCTNIPLINKYANDTLVYLFKSIGKLYLEGITINIDSLYPDIEYPISANTPSIAPLLTWDDKEGLGSLKFQWHQLSVDVINISRDDVENYYGYKINGKTVISSSTLVWKVFQLFTKIKLESTSKHILLIKDINIRERIEVLENLNSDIEIQIQKGSGNFEVNLNSYTLIVNGNISFIISDHRVDMKTEENFIKQPQLEMNHDEIYKYFEELSVEFKESFKLIQKVSLNKTDMNAIVLWKGEWIEFLDALLMLVSLYNSLYYNEFKIVHFIRQIYIDFVSFQYIRLKEIPVFYNRHTKELSCEGLKMHMPLTGDCDVMPTEPDLLHKTCQFLPYCNQHSDEHFDQIDECLLLVFQNTLGYSTNEYQYKLKMIFGDIPDCYDICKVICEVSLKYTKNEQIELITAPSEDTLDDLYLNLEKQDNLLIVGELPNYKRVLKCLKKVKAGFILLSSETNYQQKNLVYPLFKLKFNNKLYTLYKAVKKENDYNLNNTINVDNPNWKTDLKLHLNNYKIKSTSAPSIHLFGRLQYLSSAYKIIKFCHSLENFHIIRFIFYDDKSPPFSLDQPFYKEQIIKDLIINICINSTWGCLKLFTPHTKSMRPVIIDQKQLIYPLSSIKSENVRLETLGLNLTDADKLVHRRELGIFEYCGIDKLGNTMCGIGSLTDSQQLVEDKILRWEKVPEWSNEDAASIPLCYAIAFYILRMLPIRTLEVKTVLVHNGTELVSQAIINVALSSGHTVFTTYRTFEEKNKILQLFPKIQEDNVYLCERNSFEQAILTHTRGNGVDICVNTSNDYSVLRPTLRCVTYLGTFCQLNTEVLINDCSIGMSKFVKDISFYSFPTDLLMKLSPSVKEILQKEVEHGIKEGHVKPLQTTCIPATSLNIDAIDMLKCTQNSDNKKIIYKCVVNKEENLEKNLFISSAEKSYIIISDGNSFIIDLINWLINRGAKTIHVLIGQELSYLTKRLNSLMSNPPSVKISLHPLKILTDRDKMKKFLSDSDTFEEIFVVGKEMMIEVSLIDSILRHMTHPYRLVCIGSGGESVCESRNAESLPALAISCATHQIKSSVILSLLDEFIEKVTETSVIFLEEGTTNRGFNRIIDSQGKFPDNVSELLELSKKSMSTACFVEVMTSCPQYKYNKEVSPIFVIPGLKPNQMYKLTSRLFYPTFEARLPQDIDDIESVAKQLFEDLKSFKFNIFTLITNDWGGALGLELAKYLEDDGKSVLLVMLDSSPQTVQSWVEELLKKRDVNIISKYVRLPYKIKKKLYELSDWEEKVSVALENSIEDEIEREVIRNGLNILKKSLLAIMKYKANGKMFRGKYFMHRPSGSSQNDHCNITEFCKRKPIINISTASNHQDMLDDPEMARIINELIPYEYKTAAHDTNCDVIRLYNRRKLTIPNNAMVLE